jgi:transaldolase / glucose-6-phosphate isomerase
MSTLHDLTAQGQSVWLSFLRRSFILRGQLRQLVEAGVRGVVLDPAVVERALAYSSDYDERLHWHVSHGKTPQQTVEALLIDDVQRAADILQGVYDVSDHADGFVVLPLDPHAAHNSVSLVAAGRRLGGVSAVVDRPNLMLGIPATRAGIEALRQLIADGCNVYMTHIFSVAGYDAVAEAYLDGLEQFFATHSVWRFAPSAVAAVPLATVDNRVDAALTRQGRPQLKGQAAIALARVLYGRHRELFSSPRWLHNARQGAHVLRLAWANSAPLDFGVSPTNYADALVAADTIQVMSPATLFAFREHGATAPSLIPGLPAARDVLGRLKTELGINLVDDGQGAQEEALVAAQKVYDRLEATPALKRDRLEAGWQRLDLHLGSHQPVVDDAIQQLCDQTIMCRIWENDHTVWNAAPGDISAHLRWLHLLDLMAPNVRRLEALVAGARAAGFDQALVITGGAAAREASLFAETFGALPFIPGVLAYTPRPHLRLTVVDSADHDAVLRQVGAAAPSTLLVFIAASDSPASVTLFDQLIAGAVPGPNSGDPASRFVVVTSPDTPLAAAVAALPLHDLILDTPTLRGPYTALSFAGLVPAAMTGLDLGAFLETAAGFAANSMGCNCPLTGDNVGARLGVALGALAQNGFPQLHLLASPLLANFAAWAGDFTTAALGASHIRVTTGGARPSGSDSFTIHIRPDGDDSLDSVVESLLAADRPVATLHLGDLYELGGLFFLWQVAVVVAAHRLGCNPFDSIMAPAPSRPPAARSQPAISHV